MPELSHETAITIGLLLPILGGVVWIHRMGSLAREALSAVARVEEVLRRLGPKLDAHDRGLVEMATTVQHLREDVRRMWETK